MSLVWCSMHTSLSLLGIVVLHIGTRESSFLVMQQYAGSIFRYASMVWICRTGTLRAWSWQKTWLSYVEIVFLLIMSRCNFWIYFKVLVILLEIRTILLEIRTILIKMSSSLIIIWVYLRWPIVMEASWVILLWYIGVVRMTSVEARLVHFLLPLLVVLKILIRSIIASIWETWSYSLSVIFKSLVIMVIWSRVGLLLTIILIVLALLGRAPKFLVLIFLIKTIIACIMRMIVLLLIYRRMSKILPKSFFLIVFLLINIAWTATSATSTASTTSSKLSSSHESVVFLRRIIVIKLLLALEIIDLRSTIIEAIFIEFWIVVFLTIFWILVPHYCWLIAVFIFVVLFFVRPAVCLFFFWSFFAFIRQ